VSKVRLDPGGVFPPRFAPRTPSRSAELTSTETPAPSMQRQSTGCRRRLQRVESSSTPPPARLQDSSNAFTANRRPRVSTTPLRILSAQTLLFHATAPNFALPRRSDLQSVSPSAASHVEAAHTVSTPTRIRTLPT